MSDVDHLHPESRQPWLASLLALHADEDGVVDRQVLRDAYRDAIAAKKGAVPKHLGTESYRGRKRNAQQSFTSEMRHVRWDAKSGKGKRPKDYLCDDLGRLERSSVIRRQDADTVRILDWARLLEFIQANTA